MTDYYISASGMGKFKDDQIIKYQKYTAWEKQKSWKTFDTYVAGMSRLWLVNFITNDWITSRCSCSYYVKHYICKHIVGLAAKFDLFEFRPEAKSLPLGMKRKRGRPARAKKALIVQ